MTSRHSNLGTPDLRLERDGPIAWCVVDRPGARNALTPAMYRGIGRALELTAADPELRALIITGSGSAFIAGGDLGRLDEAQAGRQLGQILPFAALRDSPVPVVVAVNGTCQGSGVLIALLADISVASEQATFRVPELLRGFPEAWTAAVLPAHVGVGRAHELMLTGRTFDAAEAHRIGAVSRLARHERLLEAAEEAAREVLDAAPQARRQWRRLVAAHYPTVDESLMDAAAASPEVREGFQAFLEKRKPRWTLTHRAAPLDTAPPDGEAEPEEILRKPDINN
jgi:enoyl-CoA hydratase